MKTFVFLILITFFTIQNSTFSQTTIDTTLTEKQRYETINEILKDTTKEENFKVIKNKNVFFNKERNYLKISISGLFTVAGTVSSYLFKNEAIENNNLYEQTKNQEFYDKSRKYDIYFIISMAVTQIAFSSLIYFLFFE